MSTPPSIVDAKLRHLLSIVERHRDEKCSAMLGDADTQARQIIRQAYRDARARLHRNVEKTRNRTRQRLTSAEAQRETRRRQRRDQVNRRLLAAAWQPLHTALLARWQQPDTRAQWIDHVIDQAATTLVDNHWQIEHPADWPAQERHALASRLKHQLGKAPEFLSQQAMQAGLCVDVEGTRVDGTIAGLLHDRRTIEALLLARFRRQGDADD